MEILVLCISPQVVAWGLMCYLAGRLENVEFLMRPHGDDCHRIFGLLAANSWAESATRWDFPCPLHLTHHVIHALPISATTVLHFTTPVLCGPIHGWGHPRL